MYSNHTVKANVPEILNEDCISDVDEGICPIFLRSSFMYVSLFSRKPIPSPAPHPLETKPTHHIADTLLH